MSGWQRGPRGGMRRPVAGGWEYQGKTDSWQRERGEWTPKQHKERAAHHEKQAHKARKRGDVRAQRHHEQQAEHHHAEAKKKKKPGKMSSVVKDAYARFGQATRSAKELHGEFHARGGFFPKHLRAVLDMIKAKPTGKGEDR